MKRKGSKRKAVREDRPMLLSRRESQVVELMGKGLKTSKYGAVREEEMSHSR
jgi:DNA-binding NarL/FixJ family response regulator